MEDWEPSYLAFAEAHQSDAADLMKWGFAMTPNTRLPVYKAIREALDRHITPAERWDIDKFLDRLGISRR